nr:Iron(3+)-hydroxamate import ATP-binding protein FhuC [Candidatus Pantoea persica]
MDSLSGGERQRAWLAMLVAQNSRCLLLDEPTSALDIAHQVEVLALIQRLSRERGLTVIAEGAPDAIHAGRGAGRDLRHPDGHPAASAGRRAGQLCLLRA